MKTAVYSGSFNPLHIGHLAIMKHMLEVAGFDCVYLIVSPKNPLKEDISAESGQTRFDNAVAAVERHFGTYGSMDCHETGTCGKVKVDDIELTMPAPHYTVRTLKALSEREPHNSFTLVIGADNLADIRRWKEYACILKDYGVAVFPRKGYDLNEIKQDLLEEDPAYKIDILSAEMVDISSTAIREAVASGKDASKWLM